jgi:hypothetical protein
MNLRESKQKITQFIENYGLLILFLLIIPLGLTRSKLLSPNFYLNVDAAFFEHAGWYLNQGAKLYEHIWDIKPPLTIMSTAFISKLVNNDIFSLHLISSLITVTAFYLILYYLYKINLKLTKQRKSSLLAVFIMLSFSGFVYLPWLGFRSKYFMLIFGLLSLHTSLNKKYFLSGLFSVLSFWFFYLGIIFSVISLYIQFIYHQDKKIKPFLISFTSVSLITLLLTIIFAHLPSMIRQTIIIPYLVKETLRWKNRTIRFIFSLRWSLFWLPFIPLSLIKLKLNKKKIIYLIGLFFSLIQIIFLDFDSYPDVFGLWIFASILIADLYAQLKKQEQTYLFIAAFILAAASIIHPNHKLVFRKRFYRQNIIPRFYSRVNNIYKNKIIPDSCHYRLSGVEQQWINNDKYDKWKEKLGECK